MHGTRTSDNPTGEAGLRYGESQTGDRPADSPLGRLAAALLDRGADQAYVEPAGARTAEVLYAVVNGEPVRVWAPNTDFLVDFWHGIGSVSDPEGAADRIVASGAGRGDGR